MPCGSGREGLRLPWPDPLPFGRPWVQLRGKAARVICWNLTALELSGPGNRAVRPPRALAFSPALRHRLEDSRSLVPSVVVIRPYSFVSWAWNRFFLAWWTCGDVVSFYEEPYVALLRRLGKDYVVALQGFSRPPCEGSRWRDTQEKR